MKDTIETLEARTRNNRTIGLGLFCAIVSFFLPILSRLPRGLEWVMHYLPSSGESIFGNLFLLMFALIPPVVIFLFGLNSKSKFCLPLVFAFLAIVIVSVPYYYYLDFTKYNLAGVGLVYIPIIASFFGVVAGLIGIWIENRELKKQNT